VHGARLSVARALRGRDRRRPDCLPVRREADSEHDPTGRRLILYNGEAHLRRAFHKLFDTMTMTVGELKSELDDVPDDKPVTFKVIEEGWFSREVKYVGVQDVRGAMLKKGEHCDPFLAAVLTGSRSE